MVVSSEPPETVDAEGVSVTKKHKKEKKRKENKPDGNSKWWSIVEAQKSTQNECA